MIKEYERELNELQEGKLISKEDLQEGDEIIYNGEHYFVTLTDTGTDFVWITDDESERYNRNAQGWTIKADWIDEVIGQPEEDELEEAVKTPDRYEVARYSRFWYGIMDNHTNLLLRVGPNADYSKPLDKENNKLLLFHNREEAQSYIDSKLSSRQNLKESTMNESATAEGNINVDSMSREELMDEIDGIYEWALKGKHIDITSIIEDPKVFPTPDYTDPEGYFKGVPTDKLRGILKILRKMKNGGSLTKDDEKVFLSKNGSVNESLDFTNAADVRHRLDSYSGQYLTITFRGSYDWKYISDLLEEYNDGDEEEADLALDKLETVYGSEYKLLKALEVDEIRGFTAMDRDIIVTIKVDKDDLYHNYADLINNPSIKKDTVKILELELNESLKKRYKKSPVMEDLDFTDEAEIRKQLAKYSGQYLTITFKGSEDWKHISDLLDESINSDEEEEEELALDKLEASYRREYDLLKSLEVEEISEIVDYTSHVIVTIKVRKDNLLHNFSDNYLDFIHMPSIDTDTIKILELDKPTIQDTNTSSMTRDEMVDFIADYVWDLSDTEYGKFKDKIALNFGIIWDNLKEDPEEGVYPAFTDNGLRTIIDKIIKTAKPATESAH